MIEALRTPDDRFANLPDYDFEPHYIDDLPGFEGLRMHYIDEPGSGEGSQVGETFLCLHGQPSWSFLYRKMIPVFTAAGGRAVAPDFFGFGRSDKPSSGYDYDTFAEDLQSILEALDLRDVTLIGFSMGGGEVARYIGKYGQDRIHSVVFASAVPPYLEQTADNPEGPLTQEAADEFEKNLKADRDEFFDGFTSDFFTADDELKVSEDERQKALELCKQSSEEAALGCMEAWATTDFRQDLKKITVPTLVLHGNADGIVPLEGSGERTHDMVSGSELHVLEGAPHGCNVSHKTDFNDALIGFLKR